jgi:ADP-ribose pyrophosphatase YjhB (NUDIX family)
MTTKRKIVRRVGEIPEFVSFTTLRLVRDGFISLWTVKPSDCSHPLDMSIRRDAAVILPVDYARREIYLVGQLRHLIHFAGDSPGERGPFIAPGIRVAPGSTGIHGDKFDPERSKGAVAEFTVQIPSKSVLSYECPAGVIDQGETPIEAALRELKEETGFMAKPKHLLPLGATFPSVGGCTERLHLFIASVTRRRLGKPAGDGHENIIVLRVSFEEAWRMAESGEVSSTSAHLLLTRLRLEDFQARKKTRTRK